MPFFLFYLFIFGTEEIGITISHVFSFGSSTQKDPPCLFFFLPLQSCYLKVMQHKIPVNEKRVRDRDTHTHKKGSNGHFGYA
ncbi:hypothetical protein K431DRAFT_149314 [Polychaeton citri CBS 116435]|uniref:Uncharacterized protein n=1 Tax=Polychaeton citri CBS 116435 TaxID=1314669 RepID=A0A9P4UKU2_9PEZI|nr:hypothetical protein K431DRAFT_149314 [Polychaeton citri CBS 116435]